MGSVLQSASREALGAATARLDEHIDTARAADLKRLADDLFAVVGLLGREHALRRALADPATPSEARGSLADRLFDGKIGRPALDVVSAMVKSRWSRAGDLLEGLERSRAAAFGWRRRTARSTASRTSCSGSGASSTASRSFAACCRTPRPPSTSASACCVTCSARRSPGHRDTARTDGAQPRSRSSMSRPRAVRARRGAPRPLRRTRPHPRPMTGEQEQRLTDSLTRLYGRPISRRWSSTPTCWAASSSASAAS